jgi:hypothetical protein
MNRLCHFQGPLWFETTAKGLWRHSSSPIHLSSLPDNTNPYTRLWVGIVPKNTQVQDKQVLASSTHLDLTTVYLHMCWLTGLVREGFLQEMIPELSWKIINRNYPSQQEWVQKGIPEERETIGNVEREEAGEETGLDHKGTMHLE